MNPQEYSRRLLLSSSSTSVHCFCCLRNKNMKIAIVAACWAAVMALGTPARGLMAADGSWAILQALASKASIARWVSRAHPRMTRCSCRGTRSLAVQRHSLQRAPFHPAALRNAGRSLRGSAPRLLPVRANPVSLWRSQLREHAPAHRRSGGLYTQKIHHRLMSGLVQRYWPTLFSCGNPSTNLKGRGCILIPISTLVPSSDSESLFQAVHLNFTWRLCLNNCLGMPPFWLTHTATSSPFQESKITSLCSFSLPLSGPVGCSARGLLLPSCASQAGTRVFDLF